MHKCSFSRQHVSVHFSLCLSVRLSYSCIASKRKTTSSNVSSTRQPRHLVSWDYPVLPIYKGNPLIGGIKYTETGEIANFHWNCHLSRQWYEIGPWLLWNVTDDLELPRQSYECGHIFQGGSLDSYRLTYYDQIRQVTHVGGAFFWGSTMRQSQGEGVSVAVIYSTPYLCPYSLT